jgi:hypothetical protein
MEPAHVPSPPVFTAPPRSAAPAKPTTPEDQEEQAKIRKMLFVLCGIVVFAAGFYYLFLTSAPGTVKQTLYPVEGVVSFQGKPLPNTDIFFHAEDELKNPVRPHATTAGDGSYKLTTYAKDDGAPAGRYRVAVVWTPETAPSANPLSPNPGGADIPGIKAPGKTRLTGPRLPNLPKQKVDTGLSKYADPMSSNFTAEIKTSGTNKFDFNLEP